MACTVVVECDVQVRPGRPAALTQAGQRPVGQLPAAQVGDQRRAVIAVEPGMAVVGGVQPDPRTPTGRFSGADRFGGRVGFVAPVISAQLRQLVGHHGTLQPPDRLRRSERQIAAACTVHAGDRAQRLDPAGRGFEHLDNVCVPIGSVVGDHPDADLFARQCVADEYHAAVMPRDATPAVRRRPRGQREFVDQSRKPRRASPGAACGCSLFSRSDEFSCQGTEVTITFGMNSSRPFRRRALWLCRTCSHQWPTTYSGMKTVTTVRGDSLLIRLTYSSTGRVISRYGEAITLSGTEISLSSHLWTSS